MYLATLKTVGGLVLLTLGAELLVRAAVSLAHRGGLSPLVIGLTVVSVGTSMPELVVSLDAVIRGSEALGVGNIVGSNISNIALILGLAALVRPMTVTAQVVRRDGPVLLAVSVLLIILIQDGRLGRLEGLLLTTGSVGYVGYNVWAAQGASDTLQEKIAERRSAQQPLLKDLGWLVLGLGGLIAGADVLVEGAVQIAHGFRVPQVVIGLSVVAVGTSLPELATSLLAAYRGEGDIAIGNAVGSSILNILGILGLTAVIKPVSTVSLTFLELGAMVGTALLVLPFFRSEFTLNRGEGGLLVFAYVAYVLALFLG